MKEGGSETKNAQEQKNLKKSLLGDENWPEGLSFKGVRKERKVGVYLMGKGRVSQLGGLTLRKQQRKVRTWEKFLCPQI